MIKRGCQQLAENKEKVDQETEDVTVEDIEIVDAADQKHSDPADEKAEQDGELGADQEELNKITAENEDLRNRLLRAQAEFDNFRKRTLKEKESVRKYKAQDIANDLLPVVDSFDRALQTEVDEVAKSFAEGMEMVYRQLQDALQKHGVEKIETVGKEFDPNLHHAVMQVSDSEQPANTVVEELQKGYVLKDRVIRPAMVKVNQ